ncbi:malonate decarboxylase subunit alpha [Paraburkholderia sp. EG304]|uniref:malonate decarboxylase subunit alpha n=1 Tax=Paraburkholderia sp. EG304 TaxID=3237015 RepID=UPI0039781A4D
MARDWNTLATRRQARLQRATDAGLGHLVPHAEVPRLLHTVLEPGDRVCLEGNNQKQADFLAECLAQLDPAQVHDLHMVQSVLSLPSHLDVFERGIAQRLDFSFSGPQSGRLANLVAEGRIEIGAIHTYLELFGRYFIDLTPQVALIAAQAADRHGNLYTGPNTEDTPVIVEATAFRGGIVIAQVNEIVDTLPRVDIPADWVNFVTEAPRPNYIEPLFTRDPAQISEIQVLMAMMAIKGIYAEYGVQRLNHGIGFDTAAIELLLPTYAESLGLKGRIGTHWALNPHPALIPAIESGFVQSVHSFGSELGMERYIEARSDVFFTGNDGSMRSNRAFSQTAGLYACDMFIGSTLQIDLQGNSSTATRDRALVWRVTGGKHRYLIGDAVQLVPDRIDAFAEAALSLIDAHTETEDPLQALENAHAQLGARLQAYGNCRDGLEVWKLQGIADAAQLPLLDTADFLDAVKERSLPWN